MSVVRKVYRYPSHQLSVWKKLRRGYIWSRFVENPIKMISVLSTKSTFSKQVDALYNPTSRSAAAPNRWVYIWSSLKPHQNDSSCLPKGTFHYRVYNYRSVYLQSFIIQFSKQVGTLFNPTAQIGDQKRTVWTRISHL